jgi:transcriptional regulator with XRE-family HTH domain
LITSEQVRAARALLRWEQRDLADASKVSLPSIKRLETAPGQLAAQARTIDAIRAAFEVAGVEFTNGDRRGVRMKQWEPGERVRLRQGLERYASTFGIGAKEVATVEEWERLPGQAPSGHFRLRLASGTVLRGLPASHFERVAPRNS